MEMKGYIQNKETIFGRLDNELVMMDIQKGKYFSLNPVATYIWDLLEKPLSLEALCNLVMEEYEVGADQCRTEVQEHLNEMEQLGMVLRVEL
jgi:hypothetical protein